jgi:protein-disulfide isomerase
MELPGTTLRAGRWARLGAAAGMMVFSALTIRHFFAANYPQAIGTGSVCDINAFLTCEASAFAPAAQLFGVPIGYFGLMVGGLAALGAIFPSRDLEDTNGSIALANLAGVLGLFVYSLVGLRSLCLLCAGYYGFSCLNVAVRWRERGRFLHPSFRVAATFTAVMAVGAYGMAAYHSVRRDAQAGGVSERIVRQYYGLERVPDPSVISPFRVERGTDRFEDAPIRIVEYGDLLCPDCQLAAQQFARLGREFRGRMNVAFQFFPLEAACNPVVDKDLHPGACDLALMAAYDPSKFNAIHDEVFANLAAARDPAWRAALAKRFGVEAATADAKTRDLVRRIIQTGAEYGATSDRYAHGIRSTPTLIINNRMIIGTLPYEQLRAIVGSLADEAGERRFIENWVPPAERSRESGPRP